MPRTAARTKAVHNETELIHTEPQSLAEAATPVAPRASGRGPDGRFVAGNRGGPGNPNARHCARMLDLFRTCISDEDMVHLYRVLYEKAMKGDVAAAKLVLAYKIGKPSPCPDPDAIDRDEWDHYQQDAIETDEVRHVLGSLPSRVGNDIARTALPVVTEACKRELSAQLQKGISTSPEVENRVEAADKDAENAPPLPIGMSEQADSQPCGDADTANRSPSANGEIRPNRPRKKPRKKIKLRR
jgi:hypothetical protein